MAMIRKQFYIAPEQEAKLKRLAKAAGRSEAEIVREALDALPEAADPVLNALVAQGLIVSQPVNVSRSESRRLHQEYLRRIGKRRLGLSQAVLAHKLRAYDAVHVATALTIVSAAQIPPLQLEFWTSDQDQAAAATAEGLAVTLV